MHTPLLLVALFAGASLFAVPATPDAPPEATTQLGNFEIQVSYADDDPEGMSRAQVMVKPVDKSTPIPQAIRFVAEGGREARVIRLRPNDDGTAGGRGMVPAPDMIEAMTMNFEEIKVTLKTGPIFDGAIESTIEMETPSAKKKGKGPKVKGKVTCRPLKIVITIGVIDESGLETV